MRTTVFFPTWKFPPFLTHPLLLTLLSALLSGVISLGWAALLVSSLTACLHAWWNREALIISRSGRTPSWLVWGYLRERGPSPWDCQPAPLRVFLGCVILCGSQGWTWAYFSQCIYSFFFFSFFGKATWHAKASQPGTEPVPPALEVQSPNNHWTSREIPVYIFLQTVIALPSYMYILYR